jgi:2-keto-4-pentenoate hydratase
MTDVQALARELEDAWRARVPIAPFSERGLLAGVEEAYAVQQAWAALRAQDGDATIGRKIGLTSPGMQRQMGVDEPDFGDLWASRQVTAHDNEAEVAHDTFVQPRIEGELAFLMRADLAGPGVTEQQVQDATAAVAPAIEIIDSRIADWRIRLVDTVADNASFGGFVVGGWREDLASADLVSLAMEVRRNGAGVVGETGAAVLGSPRRAVAWLADKLASFGVTIRAGDVVLSGSFGASVEAAPGDRHEVVVAGCDPLGVTFR